MTRDDGAPVAGRMTAVVQRDGERDEVAVEEPLEIRVDGARADGHDAHARPRRGARARLPVRRGADRRARATAGLTDDLAANVVDVRGPLLRDPGARRFYTTSSCGVCGKGSLEEVAVHAPPLPGGPARRARAARRAARRACASRPSAAPAGCTRPGLFDAAGEALLVREDVGRHNAMDKVIGRALLDGLLPLHGQILCVSGRLSFELVQKAAVAGAPILVGVGAPTSLAVELAADRGMTLAGFARGAQRQRLLRGSPCARRRDKERLRANRSRV